jgi:phage gpG-like protein
MLTVTFTILGDLVFARGLTRYADKIKDYSPVLGQIRTDFHRIEAEQFDSLGARGGDAWKPLSKRYAAWKEKHFPMRPIMRLTGNLWAQLAIGTGMHTEIEPLMLKMESTLDYAGMHQQGSPKTNLPARKLVSLTDGDKLGWVKMIQDYAYDKAKEEHLL